jgi:hypothetical protein
MILAYEGDTEMDSVGLTLVNKEDGIPDKWVIGERNDIHPKGAVRLVSQRSILEGDGSTGEMIEGGRSRIRFTRGLFRRVVSCASAQQARSRARA